MDKTFIESLTSALEPLINEVVEMLAEKTWERIQDLAKPPEPKYYNRKEAAEILHITLPTLANLTSIGRITAKKVGRRVLYDSAEIDSLVTSGEPIKYQRRNAV